MFYRKSFLLKEWYFVIIRSELYISLLVCLVRTIGADFKTEVGFLKSRPTVAASTLSRLLRPNHAWRGQSLKSCWQMSYDSHGLWGEMTCFDFEGSSQLPSFTEVNEKLIWFGFPGFARFWKISEIYLSRNFLGKVTNLSNLHLKCFETQIGNHI